MSSLTSVNVGAKEAPIEVSVVFTGPFKDDQEVTLKLEKSGHTVTMRLPEVSALASLEGKSVARATAAIPLDYRPSQMVCIPNVIIESGDIIQPVPGSIDIYPDGNIEICKNLSGNGLFDIVSTNGWLATSATWVS